MLGREFSDLKRSQFLNRLKSLQSLCSIHNSKFPNGLLIIPGPDGRNNKGSLCLINYLFGGACGKDLFETVLDPEYDSLEEMILLIQETSVSVFWTKEARDAIGEILLSYPFVIEYTLSSEEEDDIDLFQERKCIDFKRMMTESVDKGGVVGIPVPLGYDDVLDTENWPLLKSFGLDSVLCPTGFFTAYYVVVDISDTLDVLFKTIDSFYVERALKSVREVILPQVQQTTKLFQSKESRKSKELISAMDLLYEFGEMDSAFPVDPTLKPILLHGEKNAVFDSSSLKWKDEIIDESCFAAIVEASEPSSGLRWCRTYILQKGKLIPKAIDPEALVASLSDLDSEENLQYLEPNKSDLDKLDCVKRHSERLEYLYYKLVCGLRLSVHHAFSSFADVLDAGKDIQSNILLFLKGDFSFEHLIESDVTPNIIVKLSESEQLQVHMDCMNALGQIVKIEDVDDMGGQCLVYIRVSISNITAGPSSKPKSTIAYGETFLFSSSFATVFNGNPGKAFGFLQDSFCLTHGIPHATTFLGSPFEEFRAKMLISSSKHLHIASSLNLGKIIESSSTGLRGAFLLTDSPLTSSFEIRNLRLFTSGFVFETLNDCFLPVLLSFKDHVDHVWSLDTSIALTQCKKLFSSLNFEIDNEENGIVLVLRLKQFENDGAVESADISTCNPFSRIISSKVEYIALVSYFNTRVYDEIQSAYSYWQYSFRQHDIVEVKGQAEKLPKQLFFSYLEHVDKEALKQDTKSEEFRSDETVPTLESPGGSFNLLNNFARAEIQLFENNDNIADAADIQLVNSRSSFIVVYGLIGSGHLVIAHQLRERLNSMNANPNFSELIHSDFHDWKAVQKQVAQTSSRLVIFAVFLSPTRFILLSDHLNYLSRLVTISSVISVVNGESGTTSRKRHIGYELWVASSADLVKSRFNSVLFTIDQRSRPEGSRGLLQGAALSQRLTPGNLWIDPEILESLSQTQKILTFSHTIDIEAKIRPSYGPLDESVPRLKTSTIKLRKSKSVSYWNLDNLCVILRLLFPSAILTNSCNSSCFTSLTNKNNYVGIRRALELAQIKTFFDIQFRRNKEHLDSFLTKRKKELSESVYGAIFGVQAIIRLPKNYESSYAFIEACSGSIIIRPLSVAISSFDLDNFTICASIDNTLSNRLDSLFEHCWLQRLERRDHKELSNLEAADHEIINNKYSDVPLPSGWWYDGNGYVDIHGTRKAVRPDLENIGKVYLQEVNHDVELYNKMLIEVEDYLN